MEKVDMEPYKRLGERIREERIRQKMSQAELAERARISLPQISNVEQGKKQLRTMTFVRIAEALQVSTDSLLRPDVPEVAEMYASELHSLLADCSPAERDSIIKVVRDLKSAMRVNKENNDE